MTAGARMALYRDRDRVGPRSGGLEDSNAPWLIEWSVWLQVRFRLYTKVAGPQLTFTDAQVNGDRASSGQRGFDER